MYACLDRPVTTLPAPERRILGATRAWVHVLTLAGDVRRPADATAWEERFDAAMRLLDTHSVGTITFQRPCHPTVEEDEAVVLGLWQLVQADRLAAANAVAAALVGSAAPALVRAIVSAASALDA